MSAGLLREAAKVMRERALAATRGPWRFGDNQSIAGVSPKLFGEGCCASCARLGPPTWTGRRDINGTRMIAHVHHDPDPWPHGIYAERPDGNVSVVNDTSEYGYTSDQDAKHIASWHPAVALAVADWLEHTAEVGIARGDWGEWPAAILATIVARTYLGRADA